MEKLVDIIHFLLLEIHSTFGSAGTIFGSNKAANALILLLAHPWAITTYLILLENKFKALPI